MADDEEIPDFDLRVNDRVPKSAAQARESAREARDRRKFATSVNNETTREARWEGEVNREIDRMGLSGKERETAVRIFLLAKALAYQKKKEKKSSEMMSAEEGDEIYEKAKKDAIKVIKEEDKATAKREKSAKSTSKKGGRKTRKHGKKGKKYTKKSRRGRKHKTRKFRTYF